MDKRKSFFPPQHMFMEGTDVQAMNHQRRKYLDASPAITREQANVGEGSTVLRKQLLRPWRCERHSRKSPGSQAHACVHRCELLSRAGALTLEAPPAACAHGPHTYSSQLLLSCPLAVHFQPCMGNSLCHLSSLTPFVQHCLLPFMLTYLSLCCFCQVWNSSDVVGEIKPPLFFILNIQVLFQDVSQCPLIVPATITVQTSPLHTCYSSSHPNWPLKLLSLPCPVQPVCHHQSNFSEHCFPHFIKPTAVSS